MVTTPLPVDTWCTGRVVVAAATRFGITSPTPTPMRHQAGATVVQYDGVSASRAAMTTPPSAVTTEPAATRRPGRARGSNRAARTAVTGTRTGPSATARPVRRAEYPHTCCIHKIPASRLAPNPTLKSTVAALAHRNDRTRSRAGSITGAGWCVVRQANATRATAATAKDVSTRALVHPQPLPSTMASTTAPMPIATSAAPAGPAAERRRCVGRRGRAGLHPRPGPGRRAR